MAESPDSPESTSAQLPFLFSSTIRSIPGKVSALAGSENGRRFAIACSDRKRCIDGNARVLSKGQACFHGEKFSDLVQDY